MKVIQKKRSLHLLQCEKIELVGNIQRLTREINHSTSLQESAPYIASLVKAQSRLGFVEVDITAVKRETERVNKMYSNKRKVT